MSRRLVALMCGIAIGMAMLAIIQNVMPRPAQPPGRVQVERGSAVATFRADSFSVQVWAIPHGRGIMIEIMPVKVRKTERRTK